MPLPPEEPRLKARALRFCLQLLLHVLAVCAAAGAFVAYEHFRLQEGSGSLAHGFLAAAALLGLAPLRALLHSVNVVRGKALHLAHGLGGLAVFGLAGAGVISGTPLADRAAMAPFALMAAPQAFLHPHRASGPEETAAARQFVQSLPEVGAFAAPGALATPDGIARATRILTSLVAKAEVLGRAEMKDDPEFKKAAAQLGDAGFMEQVRQTAWRGGLSLGLDSLRRAMTQVERAARAQGATSSAQHLAELQRQLAKDR